MSQMQYVKVMVYYSQNFNPRNESLLLHSLTKFAPVYHYFSVLICVTFLRFLRIIISMSLRMNSNSERCGCIIYLET